MAIKQPFNMNKMQVVVLFPTGETEKIPYAKFSKTYIEKNDVETCATLMKYKELKRGSFTFYLLED